MSKIALPDLSYADKRLPNKPGVYYRCSSIEEWENLYRNMPCRPGQRILTNKGTLTVVLVN